MKSSSGRNPTKSSSGWNPTKSWEDPKNFPQGGPEAFSSERTWQNLLQEEPDEIIFKREPDKIYLQGGTRRNFLQAGTEKKRGWTNLRVHWLVICSDQEQRRCTWRQYRRTQYIRLSHHAEENIEKPEKWVITSAEQGKTIYSRSASAAVKNSECRDS